ncbi:MAG: cytochrome c, partial [Planctomycetes bacterium]|nr:cytochrome c [Planctomycetota bacterium]
MVERNSLLLVTLLLGFFGNTSTAEETAVGKALYAQSCAACHGVKLEGGKTQSLIDSIWQFGQKRSYVFRNIKYGIADFAMPAYEVALTDKQIDQVIDYILAMEKEIGTPKPPLPQALHTLDYKVKV